MDNVERKWKCAKCGAELVPTRIVFQYMGRSFGYEVPACPNCGDAFISEDLAKGKMAEVESLMEDK